MSEESKESQTPPETDGEASVFETIGTEVSEAPRIPEVLSLLPLRDAVVFPLLVAPIVVGRTPYVRLIEEAVVSGERVIGIVTQKEPETESPTVDDIHPVGVAVSIRMLGKGPDATRLIVRGLQRFRIVEVLEDKPYLKARIEAVEEPLIAEDQATEVEALRRLLRESFEKIVELSPDLPDDLKGIGESDNVGSPSAMTDLMAAHAHLTTAEKVGILGTFPLVERMRALLAHLVKEVQVLELGARLQSEAAGEMSRAQREYFLREQMKAIQRELGDGDDRSQDIAELRRKVEEAALPEEARKEADRELDRMARMATGSPEYTVSRTYLELLAALPWNRSSEDRIDIPHVKAVLDEDHHGLEKVKDRILEYLSVRKFRPEGSIRQPILCLVGPPGVGKTSLGRSIARSLGKEFHRFSLGGVRDEAEIRGHRRTYIGAMPGQIITAIRRAGTNNPVLLLDEVDKVSSDFRGDPSSALLEALDPEQNRSFRDHYLDTPFDLSKVLFITTANSLDTIQGPLRDRMEVIEIAGYTEEEKTAIAEKHLVPKQVGEHGLDAQRLRFEPDGIRALVRGYTREAGVRGLERQIAAVCRKVTRRFAEGAEEPVVVDTGEVARLLGAPRHEFEEVDARASLPGVVTGLVWTPVGGDVIFIEATRMAGSKTLQLTGQLGDVMQESAKTALSYVRSHAMELGIDPDFWSETEIHVHVPAGAIPKDGPSAGITLVTALASLLTGRPVKPRLAMTGEVTLTGRVLPIGGVKEKILAARRAGVRSIILPARNRKDLEEDIPADLRRGMAFHFVDDVAEVVRIALQPSTSKDRPPVPSRAEFAGDPIPSRPAQA
ncbi:MAG: endopeptidase La [Armatimonadota bacterium]